MNIEKYREWYNMYREEHENMSGEHLAQCLDSSLGTRYYNPYWCISDRGNVYKITRRGFRKLKPYYSGDKCRERQIHNSYSAKRVVLVRLVAVYHCDKTLFTKVSPEFHILKTMSQEERTERFKKWHVHHIRKFDKDKPTEENDNANNLQLLPQNIHQVLTQFQYQKYPFNKSSVNTVCFNGNIVLEEEHLRNTQIYMEVYECSDENVKEIAIKMACKYAYFGMTSKILTALLGQPSLLYGTFD